MLDQAKHYLLESQPCEAHGNPHNPFTDDELSTKYHSLASPTLEERTDRLREVILTLDQRPLADLLVLLGAPESHME